MLVAVDANYAHIPGRLSNEEMEGKSEEMNGTYRKEHDNVVPAAAAAAAAAELKDGDDDMALMTLTTLMMRMMEMVIVVRTTTMTQMYTDLEAHRRIGLCTLIGL